MSVSRAKRAMAAFAALAVTATVLVLGAQAAYADESYPDEGISPQYEFDPSIATNLSSREYTVTVGDTVLVGYPVKSEAPYNTDASVVKVWEEEAISYGVDISGEGKWLEQGWKGTKVVSTNEDVFWLHGSPYERDGRFQPSQSFSREMKSSLGHEWYGLMGTAKAVGDVKVQLVDTMDGTNRVYEECIVHVVDPNDTWASPFSDVAEGDWFYDSVAYVQRRGIMNGYQGGDVFGVGNMLTRAELAALLANCAGADTSSKVDTTGMADVAAGGEWYTGAVNWAVENEVIMGFGGAGGSRLFGPNDPVTREQAMVILTRFAGGSDVDVMLANVYPDLWEVSSWANQGVAWSVSNSVVSGAEHDGLQWIEPHRNVQREEVAKMVRNMLITMGA